MLDDPFYINRYSLALNQGNILADGTRQLDTRRAGLNTRYNFGIKKREDRINLFNIPTE